MNKYHKALEYFLSIKIYDTGMFPGLLVYLFGIPANLAHKIYQEWLEKRNYEDEASK